MVQRYGGDVLWHFDRHRDNSYHFSISITNYDDILVIVFRLRESYKQVHSKSIAMSLRGPGGRNRFDL